MGEVYLYYSTGDGIFKPKHFGLYVMFTEDTQWLYGTKKEIEDVLHIIDELKAKKIEYASRFDVLASSNLHAIDILENGIRPSVEVKEDSKPNLPIFYDAIIDREVVMEMKRILSICRIPCEDNNLSKDEMYKKYFDHTDHFDSGNYFYFFEEGRRTFYYYLSLLTSTLPQYNKTSSI